MWVSLITLLLLCSVAVVPAGSSSAIECWAPFTGTMSAGSAVNIDWLASMLTHWGYCTTIVDVVNDDDDDDVVVVDDVVDESLIGGARGRGCVWDVAEPLDQRVDVADLAAVLSAWSCRAPADPLFLEADVGIHGWTPVDNLFTDPQYWRQFISTTQETYSMTGGIAVGDVDGDGFVDVFLTRVQGRDALWLNTGRVRFRDAGDRRFLGVNSSYLAQLESNGAALADVDNDGDLDLFVVRLNAGRNHLWINNGTGWFTEEAEQRGFGEVFQQRYSWQYLGMSVVFGDYNLDGWLDLLVQRWATAFQQLVPEDAGNRLYRNRGDGTFADVTNETIRASATYYGFSGAIEDLTNDGLPDILFVGDFGTTYLLVQQEDGSFQPAARKRCCDVFFGMGLALGDINGDMLTDYFITDINAANVIRAAARLIDRYTNSSEFSPESSQSLWLAEDTDGLGSFRDVREEFGVREFGWAWGSAMLDVGNDGDLDLVVIGGHLPNSYANSKSPLKLYLNDNKNNNNGTTPPLRLSTQRFQPYTSQTIHTMDVDGDGLLDLLEVRSDAGFRCLLQRADATTRDQRNRWIKVKTVGSVSNRQGLGALVIFRYIDDNNRTTTTTTTTAAGNAHQLIRRTVRSQSALLGHGDVYPLVGIGAAMHADVAVLWPVSSRLCVYKNVSAGSLLLAEEDDDDNCRHWDWRPMSVSVAASLFQE